MDGILLVSVGAGLAALAMTGMLLRPLIAWLRRRALLDVPNNRSSHMVPTPRGAGIVVTAIVLVGWAGVLSALDALSVQAAMMLVGGGVLAGLSWIDDVVNLPRRVRFLVHIAAVVPVVLLLPETALAAQGILPVWLDRVVVALAWLWFINLFNFMDGIDGISGLEIAHLGLSPMLLILLGGLPALPDHFAVLGAIAGGAALGFLFWNWHPAKVFLGDVGSIPLGYFLGWLMLQVALSGAWAIAFILPAYYWADATITLMRRGLRGAKITVAHREHFYQKANHTLGMSHGKVSKYIAFGNIILFAASCIAVFIESWAGIALAIIPVGGLLLYFGRPRAREEEKEAGEARSQ